MLPLSVPEHLRAQCIHCLQSLWLKKKKKARIVISHSENFDIKLYCIVLYCISYGDILLSVTPQSTCGTSCVIRYL